MTGWLRCIGIVVTCVMLGLTACRPRATSLEQPAFGLLVLGPVAAVRFGFVAGDTLQEIPAHRANTAVRDSASSRSLGLGYDPACTRFFVRQARYVVLLTADCERENAEDGESLAAFDESGRMISWPTVSVTEMDISTLEPKHRQKQ